MPYKFMSDSRWYEDVAHILIGMVPMFGWVREHLQWPPASDKHLPLVMADDVVYLREERVKDAYRDFLGYAIGDLIRTITIIVLIFIMN